MFNLYLYLKIYIGNIAQSKELQFFIYFNFTNCILNDIVFDSNNFFKNGSPNVIFAWGTEPFNPQNEIRYHTPSQRGSKQVVILSGLLKYKAEIQNLETIDFNIKNVGLKIFLLKYNIQLLQNLYFLRLALQIQTLFTIVNLFKYQQPSKRKNILSKYIMFTFNNLIIKILLIYFLNKWEVLMPPNEENIHHIILHTCDKEYDGIPKINGNCFDGKTSNSMFCSTITLVLVFIIYL